MLKPTKDKSRGLRGTWSDMEIRNFDRADYESAMLSPPYHPRALITSVVRKKMIEQNVLEPGLRHVQRTCESYCLHCCYPVGRRAKRLLENAVQI